MSFQKIFFQNWLFILILATLSGCQSSSSTSQSPSATPLTLTPSSATSDKNSDDGFDYSDYAGAGSLGGIEVSTTPTGGGRDLPPSLFTVDERRAEQLFFSDPQGGRFERVFPNLIEWARAWIPRNLATSALPLGIYLQRGRSTTLVDTRAAYYGSTEGFTAGYGGCMISQQVRILAGPVLSSHYPSCMVKSLPNSGLWEIVSGRPLSRNIFQSEAASKTLILDFEGLPKPVEDASRRVRSLSQPPDRIVFRVEPQNNGDYETTSVSCRRDANGRWEAIARESLSFDLKTRDLNVKIHENYSWSTIGNPLGRRSELSVSAEIDENGRPDLMKERILGLSVKDDGLTGVLPDGTEGSIKYGIEWRISRDAGHKLLARSSVDSPPDSNPPGEIANESGLEQKLIAYLSFAGESRELRLNSARAFLHSSFSQQIPTMRNVGILYNGSSYTRVDSEQDLERGFEEFRDPAHSFVHREILVPRPDLRSEDCIPESVAGHYRLSLTNLRGRELFETCSTGRISGTENYCESADSVIGKLLPLTRNERAVARPSDLQ